MTMFQEKLSVQQILDTAGHREASIQEHCAFTLFAGELKGGSLVLPSLIVIDAGNKVQGHPLTSDENWGAGQGITVEFPDLQTPCGTSFCKMGVAAAAAAAAAAAGHRVWQQ
jgi:hypothetical protein